MTAEGGGAIARRRRA